MTTALLTAIKQSELIDRQVTYKTKNLGKVTKILFAPLVHRVEGLVFLSNEVPPQKWLLSRSAIDKIDFDRISIFRVEKKLKPSQIIKLNSLRNQELWSDSRNRVGRLIDYTFEIETGAILEYLFTYNYNDWPIFADRIYRLSPAALCGIGIRYAVVDREMLKVATPSNFAA